MTRNTTNRTPTTAERNDILRALTTWTHNHTVAEDLTQQTMLEAWRNEHQPPEPQWRPWLFGIARNMFYRWRRDLARDLRRSIHIPESDAFLMATAGANQSVDFGQQEIASLLQEMLDELPTETRHILLMKYIDELPQTEVANRLGIHVKAVESRLHRGKRRLRDHILISRPDTAIEFGLIAESDIWHQTNIWCLSCGQERLEARWYEEGTLRFDCPRCQNGWFRTGERINQTTHYFRNGIPANPPSFAKMHQIIAQHSGAVLHHNTASPGQCPHCQGPIEPRRWQPDDSETSNLDPAVQLDVVYSCNNCQSIASFTFLPSTGIWSESGLAFTAQHPQVTMQKPVATEWQGRPAVRQTWKSLTSSGEFTCWVDTESFILLDIMVDGELQ